MTDKLNDDYLRSMDIERLRAYREELAMVLAQTATFLAQVEKMLEQRHD